MMSSDAYNDEKRIKLRASGCAADPIEYLIQGMMQPEPEPETDPLGTDQHTPGAKLDAGKPMVGLMTVGFANALLEVAKVTTYGATKYTPRGWESVPNGEERYGDAMGRHWLQSLAGGPADAESGLDHDAQVAWNALAKLELKLRRLRNVQ